VGMTSNLILLDDRAIPRDVALNRAAKAARGLDAIGVGEGDVVALLLRNDFAFIEATHAASMIGAYCVPINWHGKPDEVGYVLHDARPSVLIAHADLLAPIRKALPAGLKVLAVPTPAEIRAQFKLGDEAAIDGNLNWMEWLERFEPWDRSPRRNRATLIYTSGTTGNPKGVKREPASPEQAAAYAELMMGVYGITPQSRVLIGGPLYHASPNASLRQALAQSELIAVQAKFDAEQTLATVERHRITNAVMVPTMFVRLLRLSEAVRQRYDLSSLKWVVHTGAPCAPEIKKAPMDWLGPVVYETYGGTEVGAATLSTPHDWLAHPGSVGKLTPGAMIGIYGADGQPVAPGEVGEIFVRQPAMADFTYLNHDAKRKEIERDGLISVGDIGYLKDDRLYLCDRRADMVISAGVNIYPAEIESVLVQCPEIADCAVFGIPDDEFGESLAAAVELIPGSTFTADDVRLFLEPRVAKYKVPRRIDFHRALPREESGKIFKRKLRDPFWQGVGRRI
jgi:long-chain acyl-CoA synthetase